ncbi:MAG: PorP/SprF family type IX secretion system membrane protein [Flavobacteriales bacterium]|nr:PorP/SprF family type IX secretion system membrane protein [Flavobacteriales bacterium]
MYIVKSIFFILICISLSDSLLGQQLLHRTQYTLHDFLLNPAAAGSRTKAVVQVGKRYQWVGIPGQPTTFFGSFHSPIAAPKTRKVHHGMGLHVVNEDYAPYGSQHMMFAYAFHYALTRKTNVSLGLAGGINQFRFNSAGIRFAVDPDPVVEHTTSLIFPDMQVGILAYSKDYFVGFNTLQVLKNRIRSIAGGNSDQTRMRRHYFLNAGKKFKTGPNGQSLWVAIPSFNITYSSGSPLGVDLNLRYVWDEKFWLGGTYRIQDAVAAMIGFNVWRLGIGYSYDYTLSKLHEFSNNSHEVILELRLRDEREKNKPCHAYY